MKRFRKGLALVSILTLMVSMPVSAKTNIFVSTNAAVSNNAGDTNKKDDLKLVRSSSKKINGITFSVSFSRKANANDMTDENIKTLEDLFYQVYPQMYDRFGGYTKAPTEVIVTIEHDYQHAGTASGNRIILNDVKYTNTGYDVFTHELAHIATHKWNDKTKIYDHWDVSKLEYDAYKENFAEYCRYVYGYENGKYNDNGWELKDIYKQGSRDNSDRFFVWLDWETTSSNKDIIRDFF